MRFKTLLMGASALAAVTPTASYAAQTSAPNQPAAQENRAPPSGPPGSSTGGETVAVPPTGGTQPAETGGIADIIVTAAKVTSNVQKVPVAISTFSGEELARAGVTDVQQLNKLVPGVRVEQSGGGSASFFIRGIGSTVLNAFGDPANAFSVDGVYYSRPTGPGATLYDVARIEVLKGPQGTLYGRNATGGAFNVITNRPSQTRGGEFSLEVGNYQEVRANAAINIPVSSALAVRVAAQATTRDGYFSDGYDDDNVKAVRGSLLWKPSDALSVFLSADYAHTGGQGAGTIPIGPGRVLPGRYVVPGDARVGPSDPRIRAYANAASLSGSPILVNTPTATICLGVRLPTNGAIPLCSYPLGIPGTRPDGFVDNENFGVNLTVDYKFDFATLTAIGGYRGTKTNTRLYIGPAGQNQNTDVDQYSAEVRLASNDRGQSFKWILGAFYLNEDQSFIGRFESDNLAIPNPAATPGSPLPATTCLPVNPLAPPLPVGLCATSVTVIQNAFALNLPNVENETYAFFGQGTYSLTDWLRATAGIRYTRETKDSRNGISSQFYTRPAGVVTNYPSAGSADFHDTSYRAGIEADVARRSMAYAQFSTAFHAGGINLGVPQGPAAYFYRPEKVKSYTVGSKNRFLNNTLQLNVEGFWLDYTNLQVNSLGRINDGSVPCSNLNISAACPLALRTDNAGKARFRGVETDVQWQPWRGASVFANVLYNDSRYKQFSIPDVTGALVSYAGLRVGAVSKWTVSGGLSQRFELANGGAIIPEARTQYKGDTFMYYVHAAGNFQKAYTRTDLTLTYEAPDRRFSVSGFVRNLENHDTLLQGYTLNAETGVPWNFLNPPRTYGVLLGARF